MCGKNTSGIAEIAKGLFGCAEQSSCAQRPRLGGGLGCALGAAISAIDRVGLDLGERHERHRLPFVTGECHLPAAFHPWNHGDL
jgi:hypothetical protein